MSSYDTSPVPPSRPIVTIASRAFGGTLKRVGLPLPIERSAPESLHGEIVPTGAPIVVHEDAPRAAPFDPCACPATTFLHRAMHEIFSSCTLRPSIAKPCKARLTAARLGVGECDIAFAVGSVGRR